MGNGRIKKSIINIVINVGYQLFSVVMNFVSRTIFINILGTGYIGINSLFSNILSVLSLAELGVGTAMVYCMYEPLATDNKEKLAELTNYFKKIYRIIAVIIFLAGIAVLPFLSSIVNLEKDIPLLHVYYMLFLLDTVVSYLFVYRTSIMTADQKNYILKIIKMIVDIVRLIGQVTILLVFENYFLYITVQIMTSFLYNVFSAIYVGKKYSYIKNPKYELPKHERKSIWANIKSMFAYKVGGVILNNTDQLLISVFVSTECVGLYSNYYLPIKAVMGMTSVIFVAVQASVGNLVVEKNAQRQFEVFNILDTISFWLYGMFTVGFCVLLQDFVCLWLGEQYLLSDALVYIISITYYLTGVLYPIWCYRETVGLFQHTKNIMFYAAGLNIFFSIALGKICGLEGILLATVFARLITNIWFEPYKLFKIYFKQKTWKYFVKKIEQGIILIALIFGIKFLIADIEINNALLDFVVKGVICVIVTNVVFVVYLYRKKEIQEIIGIIKNLLLRKLKC